MGRDTTAILLFDIKSHLKLFKHVVVGVPMDEGGGLRDNKIIYFCKRSSRQNEQLFQIIQLTRVPQVRVIQGFHWGPAGYGGAERT